VFEEVTSQVGSQQRR